MISTEKKRQYNDLEKPQLEEVYVTEEGKSSYNFLNSNPPPQNINIPAQPVSKNSLRNRFSDRSNNLHHLKKCKL